MLLGLLSGYILWFIGHIDYRLLLIIIPLTIYCAYFLAGQAYSVPTVFTVNTSIIGSGYFDTSISVFPLTYFLTDYLICTFIAFAIILLFEYFWFSRYQLINLFIRDRQTEMVRKLYHLVHLLNQKKIRRSDWFESCISYTESLFETQRLAQNTQFLRRAKGTLGEEFNQFLSLNSLIFVDLKALYIARKSQDDDYSSLFHQVQSDLQNLKILIRATHELRYNGELHALPR